MPTKVLIVDDSAIVRLTLKRELGKFPDIEVVGLAPDPFVARDILLASKPDVVLLDIEMPRMDGLTFLRKIMKYRPTPTIIVSSVTPRGCDTALACLEAGAVEVMCKPSAAYSVEELTGDLVRLVREIGRRGAAAIARRPHALPRPAEGLPVIATTDKIVAIGASAGGPETIKELLAALPRSSPGIVIVQHMGPAFLEQMAQRLDRFASLKVELAKHGATVLPGKALLAPGDVHVSVHRTGGRYEVRLDSGERVSGHRPSVDVLFESTAEAAGPNAMGVILTGMGNDGARGMRAMFDAGAYNVAQDEATCVIYGMPARAVEAGGVHDVLPLDAIPGRIVDYFAGRVKHRQAS